MYTSPQPWRVVPVGMDRAIVQDAEGQQVVGIIARPDAELIVRAVHRVGAGGFGRRTCRPEPGVRHPTRRMEEEGEGLRKLLL